jgi:hypothetical protein
VLIHGGAPQTVLFDAVEGRKVGGEGGSGLFEIDKKIIETPDSLFTRVAVFPSS